MLQKNIELEDTGVSVSVIDGEIREGNTYVSSVELKPEDGSNGIQFEFDDKHDWDTINDVLLSKLIKFAFDGAERISKEELISIIDLDSVSDYEKPRFVTEENTNGRVLREIYNLFPCTTKMVSNETDIPQKMVSSSVTDLKNKGLVSVVDRKGQAQILVPTHLGIKELYTIYDLPEVTMELNKLPYKEKERDYSDVVDDETVEDDDTDDEVQETIDTKLSEMTENTSG